MKKRIAAMAVLSMLLLCRSVPAEDTPVAFEETGIRIDLEDVLAASSNYVDVTEIGIVSRDPFVAYLTLDYYAIDKEILNELIDHFYSYSEEMQGDIRQLTTGIRKDLADVVVTDIQDQDALIRMIFGELPEGVSIQEFGEFEPYRYYVVSKPGFDEPEDYESFTEYDMSPDEVREAYEMLRGIRKRFALPLSGSCRRPNCSRLLIRRPVCPARSSALRRPRWGALSPSRLPKDAFSAKS